MGTCRIAANEFVSFMETDGSRRPWYAPPSVLERWLCTRHSETYVDVLLGHPADARAAFVAVPDIMLGADLQQYPWLPSDTGGDTYWLLAFRMAALETIVHDTQLPAALRVAASMWADAHFPTLLHIESGQDYTDAAVSDVLAALPPRCSVIRHPGALPDIIDHLACLGNGTHPCPPPGSTLDVLNKLFSKVLPQRCIVRGLAAIALGASASDVEVREFLLQVSLCSLLGAYDHVSVRPPLHVRRALYDLIVFRRPDEMELMSALTPILFHALREFVSYSVDTLVPLRRAIMHTYDWESFTAATRATNDAIRRRVVDNWARGQRLGWPRHGRMGLLDRMVIKAQQVPKRGKPPSASPARTVKNVLDATEEYLYEELGLGAEAHAGIELTSDVLEAVRVIAKERDWDTWERMDALCAPPVDMRATTATGMAALLNDFTHEAMKEKLHAYLRALGTACMRDYKIIRAFFDACSSTESVRSVPMPHEVTQSQCVALEKLTSEVFSGMAGASDVKPPHEFAWCTVCNRFCGFCIPTATGKRRRNDRPDARTTRSMGHKRLLAKFDVVTGDIDWTCGVARDRSNDSKRRHGAADPVNSHGNVEVDLFKQRRKMARALRMEELQRRCRTTNVVFFNMRGFALRIISHSGVGMIVILCATCAQPYEYSPSAAVGALPICARCERAAVVRVRWVCVACETRVLESADAARAWNSANVIDDLHMDDRPQWFTARDTPGECVRNVHFCPKHSHPWVLASKTPLRLTLVLHACKRDPRTGRFAVGTHRLGNGDVLPVTRRWATADPSTPDPMFA